MHHQWNSRPPLPQWRRSHWRMTEVTWPSSSSTWSSRRSGSCQHTSGLSVMRSTPRRAPRCGRRSPTPPGKSGLVQEDAGVVDQPGHGLAVLVDVDHVLLGAVVLPLLGGQGGGRLLDPPGVLLVDEVGAVAAAALHELGRGPGEHPLAAVAEDAGPVAGQERGVEDPRPLLFVVLEAEPLVRVGRCRGHGEDVTACARARARRRRPLPGMPGPRVPDPHAGAGPVRPWTARRRLAPWQRPPKTSRRPPPS